VVTVCESGPRAAVAASVLQSAGIDARPVLDGGITDWRARGGETTSFRRCGS
jgi:rhodanese-related sulfurtransferase